MEIVMGIEVVRYVFGVGWLMEEGRLWFVSGSGVVIIVIVDGVVFWFALSLSLDEIIIFDLNTPVRLGGLVIVIIGILIVAILNLRYNSLWPLIVFYIGR